MYICCGNASYCTALGHGALFRVTGNTNTAVGTDAGNTTTSGTNNTFLGFDAEGSSATVSNEITLGNTSITKFRIPGINFVLKDNGGTPATGQVLTADGSGEGYWATPAGGGPTFATAVNPSSVASVTFTGIPSGVNTVTVGCYDLDFSASDTVEVQIGDSGGIETSGYVSSVGSQSESTNHTDAFVTQNSGMTTEARALFHLFRVDGNKWVYSSGASGNSQNNGSGMKLLSGELTQLRVKTGLGNNMSNGVIQISYQ